MACTELRLKRCWAACVEGSQFQIVQLIDVQTAHVCVHV